MAGIRSLSTQHIPTLLGLLILGIGLVGGILLVNNSNTNTFLPRASPETTPKQVRITNLTDTGFTVSWTTDVPTPGYLRYGESAGNLSTTVTDDRDQISGTVGQFQTHHVTIRSLQPNTTYYFKIGTGSRDLYDDRGKPYQVRTAATENGAARTMYGEIMTPSGLPADGALIYITSDTLSPLSTLSQSTGSWVLSLANARTRDLQTTPTFGEQTIFSLLVLSPLDSSLSQVTTTLAQSQPVPEITLGVNSDFTNALSPAEVLGTPRGAAQSKFTIPLLSSPTEGTESASLSILYPPKNGDVVKTARPRLFGTAPKNTSVTISLQGASAQSKTVNTGASPEWSYTPTTLARGAYTLSIVTTSGQTTYTAVRTFVVDTTSALASQAIQTSLPRVAGAATESSEVSYPSTASGELVSGSLEYTVGLLLISAFFLVSGAYVYIYNKT